MITDSTASWIFHILSSRVASCGHSELFFSCLFRDSFFFHHCSAKRRVRAAFGFFGVLPFVYYFN